MTRLSRRSLLFASAALLAGVVAVPAFSTAQGRTPQQLLVLVGAKSEFTDIDWSTLHRAFDNYPTELKGTRIIPFNQVVGTPARIAFDRIVLALEPEAVGRYWTDRRIRHLVQPPRTAPTVEVLMRVLVSLKGAIGYALMDPATVPVGVRALTIDGTKPSDANYALSQK